jgi:hypothetical protein
MFTLLAFIGIIVVLHYVAKGLKGAGNFLVALSGEMADRLAVMERRKADQNKILRQQNINAAEQVHIIKGADSDAYYRSRVQKEIDQLCE